MRNARLGRTVLTHASGCTPFSWLPSRRDNRPLTGPRNRLCGCESPDGMLVAYTQTRQIMDSGKSESNTQVWLARADGSRRVQLTRGEKSSSSPSFSPDGAWVYFTSSRSGENQVWRIPVDGGEGEQITNLKHGVDRYVLSPDGKQVAFTAHEPDPSIETAKEGKARRRGDG